MRGVDAVVDGAILPRFRTGDYSGGIKEGVKAIELVLTGDAAELAERVKGRRDADDPKIDWLVVIFWTLIILWFIWVTWQSTQRSAYRRGSRRSSSLARDGVAVLAAVTGAAATAAAFPVEEAASAAAAPSGSW